VTKFRVQQTFWIAVYSKDFFLESVVIPTGFVSLISERTFITQVAKICTRPLGKYVQNIQ
jgi:hypothetical protein